MSEDILKADSKEEAQKLADATGRVVEYRIALSNTQPFEPNLGFADTFRLRFWLWRKRRAWFIKELIQKMWRPKK